MAVSRFIRIIIAQNANLDAKGPVPIFGDRPPKPAEATRRRQ